MAFERIMQEAAAFQELARSNPKASKQHFAAYLLGKGYSLTELPEEEWRGVAEFFVGEGEDTAREVWLEDFTSYIGQPDYGEA